MESEARELSVEIGGTGVIDEGDGKDFPVVYGVDEMRRMWAVLFKGQAVNAGLLLQVRNAQGVGAPGTWDLSGASPQWNSAPPMVHGRGDALPERPVPTRALLPNERLLVGLLGVGVVVQRTDRVRADTGASGFTTVDRTMLQEIWAAVKK